MIKIKIQYVILFSVISTTIFSQNQDPNSYFPPKSKNWEKAQVSESNWNEDALRKAINYTESQNSTGLLVLYKGEILVEEYWAGKEALLLNDIASMQKSIVSLLCGVAISKGLLDINSPVNLYVNSGWSNSDIKDENKILVKHLLSMSSGLDRSLKFKYPPGERWSYNTKAYCRLIYILEAISKKNINDLTQEWLTEPIGIEDSKWIKRKEDANNPYGFRANLRDLGRLGLLTLNNGYWGNKNIIKNKNYLKEAFQASQSSNVKYGYLFWINTEFKYHSNCPDDMRIMYGLGDKYVYIFPNKDIVIVRLGNQAEKEFVEKFLDLMIESMP